MSLLPAKTCMAVAFSQKVRSANMTAGRAEGKVISGQKRRRIAFGSSLLARLAGRARAELHHHFRPDKTVVIEQRLIADRNPVSFSTKPSGEADPWPGPA